MPKIETTPEEALTRAKEIVGETREGLLGEILIIEGDTAAIHRALDKLLCDIARERGYNKLADFFESLDLWYE